VGWDANSIGTLPGWERRCSFFRRPGCARRRFKDKLRDVGSAREFDADGRFFARLQIILGEFSTQVGGLDADYGIVSRVVPNWAAEHLRADHSFAKAIDFALQGVFDDQVEKILGAFTAREGVTPDQLGEMPANQADLLSTEYFRFAR
jgi:hypothetical protein